MEMVLTGDRISAQDAKQAGESQGRPMEPLWVAGRGGLRLGVSWVVSTVLSGVLGTQGTSASVLFDVLYVQESS